MISVLETSADGEKVIMQRGHEWLPVKSVRDAIIQGHTLSKLTKEWETEGKCGKH